MAGSLPLTFAAAVLTTSLLAAADAQAASVLLAHWSTDMQAAMYGNGVPEQGHGDLSGTGTYGYYTSGDAQLSLSTWEGASGFAGYRILPGILNPYAVSTMSGHATSLVRWAPTFDPAAFPGEVNVDIRVKAPPPRSEIPASSTSTSRSPGADSTRRRSR
jgi:hypothetical protein